MGRIVFRSSLLLVVLVAAAAKDIPISSSYMIKHTDSCPDVGYFFRREVAPNFIDPGPCLLCFCQGRGTAACWVRDSKRCDVEKYHHNRVSRNLLADSPRVRRSPVSLSDIFFRDATRDFFNKNLPEECKPFEESFSDGCPPADWCIGCTICDCDANGRWDCHILSFCNDAEKKKIDGVKIPPPKARRVPNKKTGYRPFRKPRTSTKAPYKQQKTQKPKNLPKRTKKTTPKPTKKTTPKPAKKPTPPPKKVVKKEIRRVILKVKNDTKTQNVNPKRRRIIIKMKADNQKIKQKREYPNQTRKDIVIKKAMATHKPMTISNTIVKGAPYNISQNEYLLGQMLVKRVMSSVQKLVQTELDKLNKTMERMHDGSDCEEIQKRNENKKQKEFKYKKIGEEFRWLRDKRDVSKQTATSYYDNGRETTTDNISVLELLSNHPNSGNWINESNLLSIPLNISQKNNEIDFKDVYNDASNYVVALAVENTSYGSNTTLDEMKVRHVSFEISTENNTANNKVYNKTKQIKNNITDVNLDVKLNKISNKIDQNPILASKVITTTSTTTTNTSIKRKPTYKVHRKQNVRDGNAKKYNLKKVINKNFKDLVSINFPANQVLNEKRSLKNHVIMKNLTKKNSTQKLKSFNFMKYIRKIFNKIFFGKKKKYLQQKYDEYQILRILCENIHACNINRKTRNLLKIKIRKINAETNSIFKTMKIIKSLLHFIDIPNLTNSSNFNVDIRKLNVILRDTNGSFSKNMSETQKLQAEYIKQNTKVFSESVGRFTELLNDIIFILQKNKQETQRPSYLRFLDKNITQSFEKIRKLILKHNLVENTFIKKIYNMLSDLENKVKSNKTQVSDKRTNHMVIDSYSRNIIENLRKLKGLAQALNSSRRKREVMRDDDTMQYLLLLMEYLIKKEHPMNEEPVNDGIDLLIDTIKSAPDIKLIKKKVLVDFPSSLDSKSASSGDKDSELNDSISDSGSMSKETNVSIIDNLENVEVYRAMPFEKDITPHVSYEIANLINTTEHSIYYDNVTDTLVKKQEKTGFEKFENINTVGKRYEVFVDDDDIYPTVNNDTSNENIVSNETTPLSEPYYDFQDTTVKSKENQSGDSTGNLKWIEENFGNEIREIRHNFDVQNKNETAVAISIAIPPSTSTETPKKTIESNFSNVSEENNKEKKISTEEVMYRKQMDLLNSLDYGTPKSDFEDTKSEDDEKYMVDTYF